jgi:HD-like signal output (HDOD) protein
MAWVDQDELAASAESVEPLPHSLTRLAALAADPEADIREIAEVVSLDVSLTAQLLRQANSAALGGRSKITSVDQAVIRLGPALLLSLAMASSLGPRMGKALPQYGLQAGELWARSVAASVACDGIRSRAETLLPAETATAALLHDFGKVVLARHFGDRVLDLVAVAADNDGLDLLEAERAVFGSTHAQIGCLVAHKWGLGNNIVDGIAHHHEAHEGLSPVAAAVSLACTMSIDITVPEPTPEQQQRQADRRGLLSPLFGTLRLEADAYGAIVAESRRRFCELAEHYRV